MMPRYRYECINCGDLVIVFHGIKETLTDCKKCSQENIMKKLLSMPLNIKKQPKKNKKIGDITKEYIEANREILVQQKKEAKEKTNEPS
jgi:putative FmdB family regulatory protein|tara:strand:- start:178 stop:444 length:267 start_codon:yes stop_codon:yes gene_type:complete